MVASSPSASPLRFPTSTPGRASCKWRKEFGSPDFGVATSPIVVEIAGTRQAVTQSRQNIVTPVIYRDTLIFSGTGNPVMAVKPLKHGSKWTAETVWQNKDFPMYMSFPVLGGLLFGFTERKRGEFFCLKAEDGTPLWTSDGRQGDNAASVAAGSVWLITSTDANLTVARQSPGALAAMIDAALVPVIRVARLLEFRGKDHVHPIVARVR